MVQMLEHAALANDVADTLGAYHCRTTSAPVPASVQSQLEYSTLR